jgi:hypothetical protein
LQACTTLPGAGRTPFFHLHNLAALELHFFRAFKIFFFWWGLEQDSLVFFFYMK